MVSGRILNLICTFGQQLSESLKLKKIKQGKKDNINDLQVCTEIKVFNKCNNGTIRQLCVMNEVIMTVSENERFWVFFFLKGTTLKKVTCLNTAFSKAHN